MRPSNTNNNYRSNSPNNVNETSETSAQTEVQIDDLSTLTDMFQASEICRSGTDVYLRLRIGSFKFRTKLRTKDGVFCIISCFYNEFARQRAAFPFPLPLSPFPCFSFPAVLCLPYFGATKKTNFTVNFFTLQMFYIESRRNIKTFATLFWPPQENQNETVTAIAYERCISFSVVLVSDDKYPGESLTCVQSSNSDNINQIEYRGRRHADSH